MSLISHMEEYNELENHCYRAREIVLRRLHGRDAPGILLAFAHAYPRSCEKPNKGVSGMKGRGHIGVNEIRVEGYQRYDASCRMPAGSTGYERCMHVRIRQSDMICR